jgi:hypothetical protein
MIGFGVRGELGRCFVFLGERHGFGAGEEYGFDFWMPSRYPGECCWA